MNIHKSVSILQRKCRVLLGSEAETIILLIAMILDFTTSSYKKPVASAMTSTDEGIIAFSERLVQHIFMQEIAKWGRQPSSPC